MVSERMDNGAYLSSDQILDTIKKQHDVLKNGDVRAREDVIASCFKLIQELEAPAETFMRMVWAQPVLHATIRTCLDLDIFKHMCTDDESPVTSSQLAEGTSCDLTLMTRTMRVLASNGFAREVSVGSFVPTAMTRAMAGGTYQDAMRFMVDICFPAYQVIPEYLRDMKYRDPSNELDTPMQYAYKCRGEKHTFQLLSEMGAMQSFDSLMKVWMANRLNWSDEKIGFYPFSSRLVDGARRDRDGVFLVDIGGGQGNDILKLLALHPQESLPGKLICQDLPGVVKLIPADFLPPHVEKQGYDFFTPQPVKGARVYFLHSIIHDFPDEAAKKILKQVADAMEKGYSKLILWDLVIPDMEADATVAALDWVMLTFLAGAERTERQWRSLIEDPEVGLKVVDVCYYSKFDQAVIEIELA